MLDLPRGTVNSRLRRALDALGGRARRARRPAVSDATSSAALREAEPPDAGRGARAGAADRARRLRRARAGAPARRWCAGAGARRCALARRARRAAVSAPGDAVARLVRDIARAPATPTPTAGARACPPRGRLLVSGATALYVVDADGSRKPARRLRRSDVVAARPVRGALTRGRRSSPSTPPAARALVASPGPAGQRPALGAATASHRLPGGPLAADRLRQRPARRRSPAATWPRSRPPGARRRRARSRGRRRGRHGHRRGRRHGEGAADLPQRRRPPPGLVRRRPPAADRRPPPRHDPRLRDRRARRRLELDGDLLAAAYGQRPLALAVRRGERTEIRVRGTVLVSAEGRLDGLEWSPDGRWLLAGDARTGQWLLARAAGQASVSSLASSAASARARGRTGGAARPARHPPGGDDYGSPGPRRGRRGRRGHRRGSRRAGA